jgi:hypothetical protein
MNVLNKKVQKMPRKKCPKCNSTKIIKKGSNQENNSSNAKSANINLSLGQRSGLIKPTQNIQFISRLTQS